LKAETQVIRGLLAGVTFPRPDLPPFTDHAAYPGMGVYLYRHGRLTTIVRCGEVGQHGHGGHAHDDQLSFVMYADGEPVVIDPGTGCYTADMAMRNVLRSAKYHNTVTCDGRGALRIQDGAAGLFQASLAGGVLVESVSRHEIVCRLETRSYSVRRAFRFDHNKLVVVDCLPPQACVETWIQLPPHSAFETKPLRVLYLSGLALQLDYPEGSASIRYSDKSLFSPSYGALDWDGGFITMKWLSPGGECSWGLALSEDMP
jgi:hypothetical protein